ncbi:hypothetical protein Tco_0158208 [Tanacetum coccineum]
MSHCLTHLLLNLFEVPFEQQPDHSPSPSPRPSPNPSPTPIVPDSIPEPTGENLGDHSFNDTSLSGNEDEMTPKNKRNGGMKTKKTDEVGLSTLVLMIKWKEMMIKLMLLKRSLKYEDQGESTEKSKQWRRFATQASSKHHSKHPLLWIFGDDATIATLLSI